MSGESVIASVRGGWTLIQRDPVGVLLPAAGSLLLQGLVLAGVQSGWGALGPWNLVGLFALLAAGRVILASPLRTWVLAAGARELDRPFPPLRQTPSLLMVWLISAGVEGLLVGGLLGGAVLPAWWLLARGTYWGAVLLMATTGPAVLVVGAAARTAFAYAVIEATAGRCGPWRALSQGWRRTGRDWLAVMGILLSGELVFALGGLICGAGALPGLPLADLALLHRWVQAQEGG